MAQTEKKLHVKKGDTVLVLVGKSEKEGGDKGKKGKVIAVSRNTNQVIVDGINIQKKHQKARSAQDTGGIVEKTGPINASNVQIVCPACKKATRVGMQEIEGKRNRMCKKCGESLDKAAAKTEKKAKETKAKEEKPKKETAKKEPAKK